MTRYLLIGFSLALISACANNPHSDNFATQFQSTPNRAFAPQGDVPQDLIQQHIDLNKQFEYLINNGKIKDVEDYFLQVNSTDTFLPIFGNNKGYYFTRILKGNIKLNAENFFRYVKMVVDSGGQWKYISIKQATRDQNATTISALVRLTLPNGHVEYINADYHVLAASNMQLFDFSFLDTVPSLRNQIIDDTKLRTSSILHPQQTQRSTPSYVQFLVIANGGDYKSALNIYNNFSDEYKNNSMLLISLLNLAWQNDNLEDISSAWNLLEQVADETKYLEYRIYFSRKLKKFDKCLQLIDRYQNLIGNDAGIMLLRAAVNWDNQQPEQALKFLKLAISQDNNYLNAYHLLYEILIELDRYDELSTLLDIYAVKFNYNFDQKYFKSEEKLKSFSQSKIFADWVKKYPEDLSKEE